MDATPAVDWDKAIDHLKAGRCTGGQYVQDGKVCLMGAGMLGAGLTVEEIEAHQAWFNCAVREVANSVAARLAPIITEQFGVVGPDPWSTVSDFHDRRATDEEALLVLEKARANS